VKFSQSESEVILANSEVVLWTVKFFCFAKMVVKLKNSADKNRKK
jgi:hypothetical protein